MYTNVVMQDSLSTSGYVDGAVAGCSVADILVSGNRNKTEDISRGKLSESEKHEYIKNSMSTVYYIVKHMYIPKYLVEEAIDEGILALVVAADKYDRLRESDSDFNTYAHKCIKSSIREFIDKQATCVSMTNYGLRTMYSVIKYMKENDIDNISKVSKEEFEKLGVPNITQEVINAYTKYIEIDAPVKSSDESSSDAVCVGDTIEDEDVSDDIECYDLSEYASKCIESALKNVNETNKKIMKYIIKDAVYAGKIDKESIAKKCRTNVGVVNYCMQKLRNAGEFKRLIKEYSCQE